MKTKTLLELLTLSSSLYFIARDTHLIERFHEMSEKGKESINKATSESILDDNGNEMEFMDKVIYKTSQLKEELEEKIEELVISFYKKVNIAHLNEIKALNEKVDRSNMAIALLEARLNQLETKE